MERNRRSLCPGICKWGGLDRTGSGFAANLVAPMGAGVGWMNTVGWFPAIHNVKRFCFFA